MFKAKLYCITNNRADIPYDEQVEQACLGGADAVLLRDKTLTAKDFISAGRKIKDICRKHKVLFIISSRSDIALALDADGVQLLPDDIPTECARQVIGPGKLIGFSASSLGQATGAAEKGADYILAGPIFSAPQKQGADSPGIDIIRLIKKRVKIPVLAFGAINIDNAAEIMRSGADGIAASRSVCGAQNIREAAAKLKEKIILAEPEK